MARKKKETKVSIEDNRGNRGKAYDLIVQEIEKKFGKHTMIRYDEDYETDFSGQCIETGLISLDLCLGHSIPRGRIVEIYGPESSGKTTLGLHILSNALTNFPEERVAIVDLEHALDINYAQKLGLRSSLLDITQPNSAEDALNIIEMLVRSGIYSAILVDSIAALTPKAEIEGDMGASHMGLQARLMSQALRKLTAPVAKTNTALIFINQIRMKIGVMFGSPETTTGGNALKFYACQRMETRRTGLLKEGDSPYGITTRVKVVKNKVSPPFKEVEMDLIFGEGFDAVSDLLKNAVDLGIVEQAGSWYSYLDERIGQGKPKAIAWLKENPKTLQKIKEKIKEIYYGSDSDEALE